VKRPYQITSVTMLCLSAFLAYESLRLRFYTPLGPGPGFFPFWLSVLLAVLAVAMLWQASFGRPEPMPADFFPDWTGVRRIGAVVVALIGVIGLMEWAGFCLAMLGFYLFLLLVLGRQHPVVTGIIALAGSFGVYYVFVRWLAVSLPVGLFGL
jgi:putative tricarboxylic transport membrane protein